MGREGPHKGEEGDLTSTPARIDPDEDRGSGLQQPPKVEKASFWIREVVENPDAVNKVK